MLRGDKVATKKPENMSFESAVAELEKIINNLESGNLPLEDALGQFERGVALVRSSQKKLAQAEQKVQLLTENDKLTSFDTEQGV